MPDYLLSRLLELEAFAEHLDFGRPGGYLPIASFLGLCVELRPPLTGEQRCSTAIA